VDSVQKVFTDGEKVDIYIRCAEAFLEVKTLHAWVYSCPIYIPFIMILVICCEILVIDWLLIGLFASVYAGWTGSRG
jgi:hypothetical protein